MNFKFKQKKITGILTVLPKNVVRFEDEMINYNFSESKSLKLKQVMGFGSKRVVENGVTASDLCVFGLQHLFDSEKLNKEDIDALILVTQSADYLMPPTSNVIQGYFSLKHDMICLDINQGCAGYIVGLIQAFMLLEQEAINKVVLLNADVLSPKVSKFDRNSNPLIGDGASITIIERSNDVDNIFCCLKTDGSSAFALQIPAGGARLPFSSETGLMEQDDSGNLRSKNNLVMKGDEVFSFVLSRVPELVHEVLTYSQRSMESIDYFLFHQPNKFMLRKLAERIGVSESRMPNNVVENFGNASGVSIPTAITFNLRDYVLNEKFSVCLSGFGVGLTWGAIVMSLGKLSFCEFLEY